MGKFIRNKNPLDFNKSMISSIIISLISGIIGLVIFLSPGLTDKLIGIIIGVIFLLNGSNTIYKFIKRDGAKLYSFNLAFGIASAIIGILIIAVPFTVTTFITVCLGLYLVTIGANKITYGVWFKIGNDSSWLITLTIGIMMMIIGILVIINPFDAKYTITEIVGLFIIISSLLDITNLILLKRRSEKIVQIFW